MTLVFYQLRIDQSFLSVDTMLNIQADFSNVGRLDAYRNGQGYLV